MSSDKPLLAVAVVGHPGHGQAALVDALFARAPALARTVHLGGHGFASDAAGAGREALVEGTQSRMALYDGVRSAAAFESADACVLVVDARRGPQARTRDAVETAAALRVPHVVLFIHAPAGTDRELIDACELLAREIVDAAGYDANALPLVTGDVNAPPDRLLEILDGLRPRSRDHELPLWMPVHWTFLPKDDARAVTGRLLAGTIKEGDEVRLVGTRPHYAEPDVVGVVGEVHQWLTRTKRAGAGDIAGLELRQLRVERSTTIPRVTVPYKAAPVAPAARTFHVDTCSSVVASPAVPLSFAFAMEVTIHEPERGGKRHPIVDGSRPVFCFGAAALDGLVDVRGTTGVAPGQTAVVHVALRKQLPITPGAPCALRENGRTVGRAVVLHTIRDDEAPHAWHPDEPGAPINFIARRSYVRRRGLAPVT